MKASGSNRVEGLRPVIQGVLSGLLLVAIPAAASAAERLLTFDPNAATPQATTPAPATGTPAPAASPDASASAASASTSATVSSVNPNATFMCSNQRLEGDGQIGWPGFLTGLRGFEQFYDPIGQPLYFESPFIETSIRLLYLHHEFSPNSELQGGHLDVIAAQARVAITERLALIATKDGFSWLNAGALPEDSGSNDLAAGLKYAVIIDRQNDFVLTPGVRFEFRSGAGQVLQGGTYEFSPFVSFAKGFGDFHIIGDVTDRIPTDSSEGNNVLQWDTHFDYDLGKIGLKGVAPTIEVHGLHYLSNGDRTPLNVGGLDYTNLGSTNVRGDSVVWMGVGGRVKFTPNFSVGCTYEFALTNKNADIMDNRVTLDFLIVW